MERNDYEKESEDHGGNEGHECVVVARTHAVVDPRAVVVKAFNASVADGAVLGPGGPHHFAVRTHFTWVNLLKQVKEREGVFKVAWVHDGGCEEGGGSDEARDGD